ncbi:MAG: autotransporter domain-containing protein, partial [Burkholderiaceae bacterium]|nr:autotransporter domain-containing protein [Burkholderiaceae bacterium]
DGDNSDAKLIVSGTFESNEAVKNGGAIYNTFYAGTNGVEVSGVFTGNKAGVDGGAIFNDGTVDKSGAAGGVMTIADSSFTGNVAMNQGGAIYNSGTLTFKGTNTFSGNMAGDKANDIYNEGTITLAEGSVLSLAGGITGEGGVIGGTGSIVVTDADATIAGQTVADSITASATGDVNDALGGDVSKLESNLGGITVTGMEEGAVMGAVGPDGEMQVNAKTEALAEKVTLAPQMITRIMMNDVRKRMGDLRAAEGTHGVWARYNGGQMAGSGMEADFSMVQVGIDTIPVVDAPRFGVAFSYAQTEADDAHGSSDMDSFSLAFYGTKMYDNGMFVDVIGRMATMDTDLVSHGATGKMDNVALSLSGELGWRFDVTDRFFFEPSVEATYTYTNADTFTMSNGGTYELEAMDSLVGRAGFAAGFKCPANKGDIYVRAAVVHEFMGDTTMNSWNLSGAQAAPIEADGEDTYFEYAIGAQFNVNKNTYVYADVERTEGANVDEDWRANVGVRFAF